MKVSALLGPPIGPPNNTEFETLSYTWGTEAATEALMIHEKGHLKVTPNLASFLRQRREEERTVVLWVDAVCINQQDIEERKFQVMIMGMVYLKCAAITVWLGPESENSDMAIDELVMLAAKAPYATMPKLATQAIEAIENLLRRPWWERVWIVQEICWGGGVGKMWKDDSVTLRCGRRSIQWNLLVMACARIKVDESENRQTIAGIDKVLHLDYVRWSAGRLFAKIPEGIVDARETLQLVADYRHFNATDPRDKIYGILGLAFSQFTGTLPGFKISYQIPVEDVYAMFTIVLLRTSAGLEVLRHCTGASNHQRDSGARMMPSWVPDWSQKRRDTPLPSRAARTRGDIPWWAVSQTTVTKKNTISLDIPHSYDHAERQAKKALEMEKPRVRTDPQEWLNYLPREIVDQIQSLVDQKMLVFAGVHDEHYIDPKANLGMYETAQKVDGVNQKLTQRNFVRNWFDEDKKKRPVYAAGGHLRSNLAIQIKTVDIEGIPWDEIETIYEAFPENLHSSWENSTVFLVVVGRCKQAALQSRRASPYPSTKALHEAFWDTLVAGQDFHSKNDFEGLLPELPKDWIRSEPVVTFQNPRQAEQAEREAMFKSRSSEFKAISRDIISQDILSSTLPPLTSSDAELQELRTSFQRLADLWSQQPYDLYHRPFNLPGIVPDPYWQSRRQFDIKALEDSARSRRQRWRHGFQTADREETARLQKLALELYGEAPSIVPQLDNADVDFELEKYALGRRFFITKKGYMGLAPLGAQSGDNVVVLFGSHVPFILRSREAGHYEVVGETYVSGIMKGEVPKEFDGGKCQAKRFVLA
ncbi:Heterokaryon incompatibility protein 6, OR allele [Colletotrichum siamense]|uniref:Heterokaryon incompatibility protein 6, OR allele n=1 Tax=Colletotrichum siamense TaxID=690259 RepID=A0A9P5EVY8_COLSI|nr:Heterokaryon incompatibility protein 6, OR allele [Colletotrichum siamense]KAF4860555.1 Heterokaryon incompatibility protein 6, OR allele [Colletotrichum siamense]